MSILVHTDLVDVARIAYASKLIGPDGELHDRALGAVIDAVRLHVNDLSQQNSDLVTIARTAYARVYLGPAGPIHDLALLTAALVVIRVITTSLEGSQSS